MDKIINELGEDAAKHITDMMWIKVAMLGQVVEQGIGKGNGVRLAEAWIHDVSSEMYEIIKRHQNV